MFLIFNGLSLQKMKMSMSLYTLIWEYISLNRCFNFECVNLSDHSIPVFISQ